MNIPMNSVSVSVTAERYITAETVKLIFNVNFVLDEGVDARAEVEKAAAEMIPGAEWYVTGMSKVEDARTGMEIATYRMNVRVKESVLNGLTKAIERTNRKGLTFELQDTDYTPTQAQMDEANKELRKELYAKAKDEAGLLNELISENDENWMVGSVNFQGDAVAAKAMRSQMYNSRPAGMMLEAAAMGGGDDEEEAGITQRVSMTANVVLTRKVYARL